MENVPKQDEHALIDYWCKHAREDHAQQVTFGAIKAAASQKPFNTPDVRIICRQCDPVS
jgi:hypothetical protein